jgi:hypothetical protein
VREVTRVEKKKLQKEGISPDTLTRFETAFVDAVLLCLTDETMKKSQLKSLSAEDAKTALKQK